MWNCEGQGFEVFVRYVSPYEVVYPINDKITLVNLLTYASCAKLSIEYIQDIFTAFITHFILLSVYSRVFVIWSLKIIKFGYFFYNFPFTCNLHLIGFLDTWNIFVLFVLIVDVVFSVIFNQCGNICKPSSDPGSRTESSVNLVSLVVIFLISLFIAVHILLPSSQTWLC